MPTNIDALRRLLLPALIALLIACWLGGGVTEDDTSIDEWLQLLALPVGVLAIGVLAADGVEDRLLRCGLGVALLVFLVPALQLLPLPPSWWAAPAARQALAADLAQAGIASPHPHWSLSPFATEGSLWSLLPALAAFLATIALPSASRRRLVQAIVLLVLFNVVFAFFQAGLPRDSGLRLYREFNAGFGGLLVNTNHQATACIIGMVLSVGLAAEARIRAERGETRAQMPWWYAGLAAFFLLVVPLSTSRAGMAIALPALAGALLMTGLLRLHRIGRSKRATAIGLVIALLAMLGVRAAMGWMAIDEAEELRHVLARAAVSIGNTQAPLGSGVGSFVQVFEQAAPSQLWLAQYVNHAHNEYAQWWLTAGVLGMLALGAALAVLAVAGWRIARAGGHDRHAIIAGACFVAVGAVLAHSWADYPLRTTTLMATTAALAGLMLAELADARWRDNARRTHRHREDAQTLRTA